MHIYGIRRVIIRRAICHLTERDAAAQRSFAREMFRFARDARRAKEAARKMGELSGAAPLLASHPTWADGRTKGYQAINPPETH